MGLFVRPVVCAWEQTSPARRKLAAWERAWDEAFATWLAAHAAAHGHPFAGPADARRASLALTGLVEGSLFAYGCYTAGSFEAWLEFGQTPVIDTARLLLDHMTVHDAARHPTDPPPLTALVAPPAAATLEASSATAARVAADAWAAIRATPRPGSPLAPERLVKVDRLQRRLGVTERRLYSVWPSAAAMNIDLLRAMVANDKEFLRCALVRAIDRMSEGEGADAVLVDTAQHVFTAMNAAQPARLAANALAWLDVDTGTALKTSLTGSWWDRTVVRAVLGGIGRRVRMGDGIDVDGAGQMFVCLGYGLQMMAQLRPDLVDEVVDDHGGAPLFGWLARELLVALTEPLGAATEPDPEGLSSSR